MVRGILVTCHVFTTRVVDVPELWRLYRSAYSDAPFVRFVREKNGPFRLPDPKVVIGSNFCDIGFDVDHQANRIVAISAIDNLIKGGAGNAVQTMNLMLGLKETSGLQAAPLHPV
jgi:N-acetyl-gamma-glutamyl-phosphate/LysW-gamma-L-alpha-aminoadipyl-6-phosphate reductase